MIVSCNHWQVYDLPHVGQRACALEVGLGIWFITGRLASVGVGGHTVEANLVAPGQEVEGRDGGVLGSGFKAGVKTVRNSVTHKVDVYEN